MDSNNLSLRLQVALTLLELGDTWEARQQLDKAEQEDPSDPYIYLLRGKLSAEWEELLTAGVHDFCKALIINPDFIEARQNLLKTLEFVNEDDDQFFLDEFPHIQKLAEENPQNPWVQLAYAELLSDVDESLEVFERANKLHPENEHLALSYARLLLQAENSGMATQVLQRSKQMATSAEYFNQLGDVLLIEKQLEEAQNAYQRATILDPKLINAWWGYTLALNQLTGDKEKIWHTLQESGIKIEDKEGQASLGTFVLTRTFFRQKYRQIFVNLAYDLVKKLSLPWLMIVTLAYALDDRLKDAQRKLEKIEQDLQEIDNEDLRLYLLAEKIKTLRELGYLEEAEIFYAKQSREVREEMEKYLVKKEGG